MKLKAMWCDGLFYPATIVQISEDPKWAKAPVKVNFTGYGDERDVWVGLDKLMNETLPKGTKEAEPKAEAEAEAQELAEHVLGPEGTMAALDVVVSLAMTSKEVARLALRPHTAMAEHHNTSPPCRLVFLLDKRELADDEDLALLRSELTEPLELTLVKRPFSEDELENAKELLVALERRAHEAVDDETSLRLYQEAEEALAGYEHYEVSNFARAGWESAHNLRYWHNQAYAGFGTGAYSYLGGVRARNHAGMDDYLRAPGAKEESLNLSEREVKVETLIQHFRLRAGLPRAAYVTHFGATPEADFGDALAALIARGLLQDDGDILRPTAEGFYLNNEIGLALVG